MPRRSSLLICAFAVVALSYNPAFSKEFFVEVSAGAEEDAEVMFSRVGVVHEGGIDWGNKIRIGKGKSPCVSVEGMNAVVVHRGHTSETEDELFYHIGVVDLTSMSVAWGPEVRYVKGDKPFVTLKGTRVIAVYQAKDKEKLFIMNGTIDVARKQIAWGEPALYDPKGRNPSLDLTSGP